MAGLRLNLFLWSNKDAGLMAESAYAVVSKTIGSNPVWVQVPLKPPDHSGPLPFPKTNAKDSHGDRSGAKTDSCKKSKFTLFLSQFLASRVYHDESNIVTGRRSGLKIRRRQLHGGSTPPPGTNSCID